MNGVPICLKVLAVLTIYGDLGDNIWVFIPKDKGLRDPYLLTNNPF